MSKYKYILFDWDGCLAKTLEVWLGAYKASLKDFGVEPNDEDIASHFGDWELPKYFGVEDFEKCNSNAVDVARDGLKSVELYDGALELLQQLQSQYKTALLSSSSGDILRNGVAHNGLEKYFDVILSGDDVTKHKPDPEVINKGLKAIGGHKTEAVMIGDSRKDLGVARNAEVDSILVYPESHSIFYSLDELKTYEPTHVCSSLNETKNIILG